MAKPTSPFQIDVSSDKRSNKARIDRGTSVAKVAPGSPLYQSQPDLQASAAALEAAGNALRDCCKEVEQREADARKAREKCDAAQAAFDTCHGGYASQVRRFAKTPAEVNGLGMKTRERAQLGAPVPSGVEVSWDPGTGRINAWVRFADGRARRCLIEMSPEPATEGSYVRADGHGAKRSLEPKAPGAWWIRAATQTADGRSDWCSPVRVMVYR